MPAPGPASSPARIAPALVLLALCASCGHLRPDGPDALRGEIVDLTHAFDAETIYWPTEEGFVLERELFGFTERGYFYSSNRFRTAEHGGTHMDAPIHFAEGGHSVDEVPLERLLGEAVRVDVEAACRADRDHAIGVADLEGWERRHGRIPDGAIVLLRTGFARHWPDRVAYMGTDARGPEAVAGLHFPGLHRDAAHWLIHERRVRAVGLDTPSIDPGPSQDFWAHRVLFEANVPAFENLAGLERLPARGFRVVALPMKIRGGSGAPLRVIAILP
jgi:kynurenine formamidase